MWYMIVVVFNVSDSFSEKVNRDNEMTLQELLNNDVVTEVKDLHCNSEWSPHHTRNNAEWDPPGEPKDEKPVGHTSHQAATAQTAMY